VLGFDVPPSLFAQADEEVLNLFSITLTYSHAQACMLGSKTLVAGGASLGLSAVSQQKSQAECTARCGTHS
jgi:hypothetical protein